MNDALTDRTLPQDIEAEQAVLGSVFLNGEALVEAAAYLKVEDFYRRAHQLIFQAMLTLSDRDEAIDAITVRNKLEEQNQVDDIGGVSYLAELTTVVPTAANVEYYSKIVSEKAMMRRLIGAATAIVQKGYAQDQDITSMLSDAERDIMDVSENTNRSGFQNISDVIAQSMDNIDQLSQNDDEITGLPSGFIALDRLTTGFQSEELIILAARPAVGKTAFALNIAQNVGTKTDKAVAIFSLEMGAESLVNRMLCAEGNIDANHLRTGQLEEDEWQKLIAAMGSLSATDIYIDDTPGIKISEIRAKCRRLAKENGNLGLVLIDYLQLIEGTGRENRQQEVSEISRQLKKLAKELKVPVIALSQLSRGVEQRQDKRPVLSDIRESGSIEQDADIVAFLYREDYYRPEEGDEAPAMPTSAENQDTGEIEVIIEKNRSGGRGVVKLQFIKKYNKFSTLSDRPEPM